jgi:hypothetical protein
MNGKSLGGLVVLNVALLFVLGLLSFSPQQAEAQLGGRGGDYIMVAGTTPGKTASTLYVTELNSGTMLAVVYDASARALVPVGARKVSADFEGGAGR